MKPFNYAAYQPLFDEYGMKPAAVEQLQQCWREPHRYFHTETHLDQLVHDIEQLYAAREIGEVDRRQLLMAAFFHDVVYEPTADDNEERSAALFRQLTKPHADTSTIEQLILDTKTHQPHTQLSTIFCELDMAIIFRSGFEELLAWEKGIFREYQFADYGAYKAGRTAFLQECVEKYPQNQQNLENLIVYVRAFRPHVGVYPGSFNPFHNGHLNILEKAERIFDKVIIAQGINPEKDSEATVLHQMPVLRYRQTEPFSGLLTNYLTEKEQHVHVTLVRGLRNGDDLAYEVNQLRFMEEMKPDMKVVFIRCDKQFDHISSSAIRNLEKIELGLGRKYVPEE